MKDDKDFKDLEERVFDLECKCNLYVAFLKTLTPIAVGAFIAVAYLAYLLYKNQVI